MQLVWRWEDRIIPVAHAQVAPSGVAVHVRDGAGHLPHMAKSGEVNRLIRRFIER